MPLKLKIVLFSFIVVCLIAPISFDVATIPITLQTFILFSVAALFGKKVGFWVAALYLIAGATGLPVYGSFTSGYEKLYGPTAGFLWAFPFVNYYLGWECERKEPHFVNYMVNFFRAHILLLIPGFIVLYLGLEGVKLWSTFVYLLPGLIIKSAIGGIAASYIVRQLPGEWTPVKNKNIT